MLECGAHTEAMDVTRDQPEMGPRCPQCASTNTINTIEHVGNRYFFCADCEHSWRVEQGGTEARSLHRRRHTDK